MSRSRVSRAVLVATAGLSVVTVALPNASASAPRKVFHEQLATSPAGTLIAGDTYTFTFTLTNDAKSPQAFGSAKILVPTGYTVAAGVPTRSNFQAGIAPDGSILVTSTGPTGTGVPPSESVDIPVTVKTPTDGSCNATWTTFVKQSNDFSGAGNDFQPGDPAPTTTTGANHLTFTRQPSTTQYDDGTTPRPVMPTAPIVTMLDPCGNAVTTFTGAVTMTDTPSDAPASPALESTGSQVNAVAGVATFPALAFTRFGISDTLTAAATGVTSVTSDSFDIVQKLVDCAANKSCATGNLQDSPANPTTITNISAASGADPDVLTATIKGKAATGIFPKCDASGEPPLGAIVTFNVSTRGKTVTMTLPKTYVNQIPNNGTPFMDVCLDVLSGPGFTDKFGNVTTQGVLPDCSATITTVCVQSRKKNAGNEVITFVLPPGDPKGMWL